MDLLKTERADKKMLVEDVNEGVTAAKEAVKRAVKARRQREIEQKGEMDQGLQRMAQIEEHFH
jgi:hypothetical protein